MSAGSRKRGQIEMVFKTHGGRRRGAGRKPKGQRRGASHAARPEHDPRHPVHVTMRVVGSACGLRRRDIYLAVREATNLIVEADSRRALSKGIHGFSISAARQITARGGDRRTGRVIGDPPPTRSRERPWLQAASYR